uniref:Uncharacterized protein n=1 Tax=Corethron hystrix TaxID=216773 RepID=A0A7S1FZ35_9STRA
MHTVHSSFLLTHPLIKILLPYSLEGPPLFDAVNVGNDSFESSWRRRNCRFQTCSLHSRSYRGWGCRMSHTTGLKTTIVALRRTVEIISVVIDGIEESPFAEDDYGR